MVNGSQETLGRRLWFQLTCTQHHYVGTRHVEGQVSPKNIQLIHSFINFITKGNGELAFKHSPKQH